MRNSLRLICENESEKMKTRSQFHTSIDIQKRIVKAGGRGGVAILRAKASKRCSHLFQAKAFLGLNPPAHLCFGSAVFYLCFFLVL